MGLWMPNSLSISIWVFLSPLPLYMETEFYSLTIELLINWMGILNENAVKPF